jgi:hypothetical protein
MVIDKSKQLQYEGRQAGLSCSMTRVYAGGFSKSRLPTTERRE